VGAQGIHGWEEKEKGERRERRHAARPFYIGVRMWGTTGEGMPHDVRGKGVEPVPIATVGGRHQPWNGERHEAGEPGDVWAPATVPCDF
jgi:hypothetical protein